MCSMYSLRSVPLTVKASQTSWHHQSLSETDRRGELHGSTRRAVVAFAVIYIAAIVVLILRWVHTIPSGQ
jgi:hypothetical protein